MQITGKTRLVGVFGCAVGHKLSPQMHNAAFRALGLDWCYVAFEVAPAGLEAAVAGMRALNLAGVNVTIPHKSAVMNLMDEVDELARLTGAVNTVVNRDGRLEGYNTDVEGFGTALERSGVATGGKDVVVLGCGGAARAVAVSLALGGVSRLTVAGRRLERAEEVARLAREISGGQLQSEAAAWEQQAIRAAVLSADIVVNCTPVGKYPGQHERLPIEAEWLGPHMAVCDLVYHPRRTGLLRTAEKAGCKVVEGVLMLVYQGAASFRLWTGKQPPEEVMQQALAKELENAGGG
jgi:shikimate dehydrogenase